MNRCTLRGLLLLGVFSALGCEAVTVLQLDFEGDAIGAMPAPMQDVGTVAAIEGSGASVRVVASPQPAADPDKWVRITRIGQFADIPSLRGQLTPFQQDGRYLTTLQLFIAPGAGVATLQFEPQNSPNDLFSFFHVDFMPDGKVRLNDDPALVFGDVPRGQVFSVAVNLNVSATAATATVTLLGAASGSLEVPLTGAMHGFARQFSHVRLWMGFPHQGSFFADDLSVLRSPP
jgi:hypothetical protein